MLLLAKIKLLNLRNIKEILWTDRSMELRDVNRYGFGISIPISAFSIKFDYSHSKWEDDIISFQFLIDFQALHSNTN